MKTLIIFLIFFPLTFYLKAVEVIDLHLNKSIDQMVLDEISGNKIEKEEDIEILDSDVPVETNQNQITSSENDNLEVIEIEEEKTFLDNYTSDQVNKILNNLTNIKSKLLQNELNDFIFNLELDYEKENDRNIFFHIVDYYYKIGDISKSYSLIKSRNIEDDENINFYHFLEINYLLSTSQLENACNFKEIISTDLNSFNNYIDKIEIFCLILEGKKSEANLLNSIMLETEASLDQNFQNLMSVLIDENGYANSDQYLSLDNLNFDLVFLYSAMARIAEIPLNKEFLKVDPLNLAIPIILNKSTPINLRLKAANHSFINNLISIDSLAALYQSVDFNSNELNNPNETIKKLSDKVELIMAYHFQYINIQIFPTERLKALIDFWDFAKVNKIENIAYSLSNKIIDSIEIKQDHLDYSPQIAISYINNKNLEKATKWIDFYEKNNGVDDRSTFVKLLININSTNEVSTIIDSINLNYETLIQFKGKNNEELFFVLYSIFDQNNQKKLVEDFENIFDSRPTISLFISENIESAIKNSDQNKFLIYSIISLNNMQWKEIPPSHLKLLLEGFLIYKNGSIIKEIILEIFENYQLI